MLPSVLSTTSAPRSIQAFAVRWLAYALSYRRFAVTLTSAGARLGADADRYSFTVVDFHLLLLAGFDRRTGSLELCAGFPSRRTRSINRLPHTFNTNCATGKQNNCGRYGRSPERRLQRPTTGITA
jgi:hypothetical protein